MKILTLTSSFPKTPDSFEGNFIRECISNQPGNVVSHIVNAPHFPGAALIESQGPISVFRFRYFFPTRYERLAYGSGVANNLRSDPLCYFQILPFCLAGFISALRIVSARKIDVVHTHWLLPQGLNGAILHYFWNIPHIATIHGTDLNLIKKNFLLKLICRFIVRNSDIVTVNSRYMKDLLLSVVPGGKNTIHIVPMGVDPGTFAPMGCTRSMDGPPHGHQILCVGRLIDWKGINFLIDALPEVQQRFPDSVLVIVGTGPEEENLKRRVRELELSMYVTFRKNVSPEDLRSLYRASAVFVLPSINKSMMTEGLGVVLLEAMAAGCPVIGSNVGGIPDIIVDGVNGFLVPEQDPAALSARIVQIFSDDNLKERFRHNGFTTIRDSFSWNIISQKFLDLYFYAAEKKSTVERT